MRSTVGARSTPCKVDASSCSGDVTVYVENCSGEFDPETLGVREVIIAAREPLIHCSNKFVERGLSAGFGYLYKVPSNAA
jgi:hypothetical protein